MGESAHQDCAGWTASVEDPQVPFGYDSVLREYSVSIRQADGEDLEKRQLLVYCPFCGVKFPVTLRDQLYDELEGLMGEFESLVEAIKRAPIEYQSSAWWEGRYDESGRDGSPAS